MYMLIIKKNIDMHLLTGDADPAKPPLCQAKHIEEKEVVCKRGERLLIDFPL